MAPFHKDSDEHNNSNESFLINTTVKLPLNTSLRTLNQRRYDDHNDEPEDLFLYYSNDANRMKRLMMLPEDEGQDAEEVVARDNNSNKSTQSSSRRHTIESSTPVKCKKLVKPQAECRRTSLSFELHPDLILEDVLEELYGGDEEQQGGCCPSSSSYANKKDRHQEEQDHDDFRANFIAEMKRIETMSREELFAMLREM